VKWGIFHVLLLLDGVLLVGVLFCGPVLAVVFPSQVCDCVGLSVSGRQSEAELGAAALALALALALSVSTAVRQRKGLPWRAPAPLASLAASRTKDQHFNREGRPPAFARRLEAFRRLPTKRDSSLRCPSSWFRGGRNSRFLLVIGSSNVSMARAPVTWTSWGGAYS